MIKSAIQNAYRTCTYLVCTVAFTTSAAAEEWQTRCLSALETGNHVDVSGLSRVEGTGTLNAAAVYHLPSDAILTVETRARLPQFCSVTHQGAQALTVRASVDVWMDAAVASGSFQPAPAEPNDFDPLIESTTYRAVQNTDGSGRYLVVQFKEHSDQGTVIVQVRGS